MTVIDIEDTVTIHRPPVGEDRTRVLPVYANHDVPRRSTGSGKTFTAQSAFSFVGTTGELPIIITPAPAYTPRHRAKDDAEIVKPPVAPAESAPPPVAPRRGLFARLLGRIGG